MPLELRRATQADVPALLEQMQPFNAGEHIPWQPERIERALRQLLEHEGIGLVVVAIADATLRGYVVLTFGFDLEWGGRDAFVTELWVAPEARRTGLGQRLLRAAQVHARAEEVHALHLVVRPENDDARRLYASEGFKPVPRLLLTKPLD